MLCPEDGERWMSARNSRKRGAFLEYGSAGPSRCGPIPGPRKKHPFVFSPRSPVESGRTRATTPVVQPASVPADARCTNYGFLHSPCGCTNQASLVRTEGVGVGVHLQFRSIRPGFLRTLRSCTSVHHRLPKPPAVRFPAPRSDRFRRSSQSWRADPSSPATTVESPPGHRACDLEPAAKGADPLVTTESVNSMCLFVVTGLTVGKRFGEPVLTVSIPTAESTGSPAKTWCVHRGVDKICG